VLLAPSRVKCASSVKKKQINFTNYIGVKINPMAELQPATHVHRFKVLNAIDMVGIQSLCV
jgi:hypothetical protein